MHKSIVFQDNWILVANKPAGLPSQATLDPKREHFYGLLQEHLGSNQYLGLLHRLDVGTSGLMVFSKARSANVPLSEQIASKSQVKIYAAVVRAEKPLPEQWIVENHLKKIKGPPQRMQNVKAGGDYAKTSFVCLKQTEDVALVAARLWTGRMHQIRTHLSYYGAPVWGDGIYAPFRVRNLASRTLLHSWVLGFKHPRSNEWLEFTAPIPEDFAHYTLKRGVSILPDTSDKKMWSALLAPAAE